jgi:hypothetical protein
MGNKRRKKRNVNGYQAAAGLLIFFIIVSCMVIYTKRSQNPAGGYRSVMDLDSLPQRVNENLGRPLILGITVDKGATIKWQPLGGEETLGYNLYRFKSADDPGEKVNASIILDTIYFDDDGSLFNSYSVAAVDSRGVQGPVSEVIAAVQEPVTIAGLQPTKPSEVMKDVTFTNTTSPEITPDISDCTAPGMSYHGTWYLEHYPEVYGTTLMVTPYAGDYVTYTFQGTGVTVLSVKHWNYGIMDIYIDGELKGSADLYSVQVEVQSPVFTVAGLTPGAHTIKLVCSGRKNPLASYTFIAADALQVK